MLSKEKNSVHFSGGEKLHILSELIKIFSSIGLVPFPPCLEKTWLACIAFPEAKYETVCSFNPVLETYFYFLAFKMFSYTFALKLRFSAVDSFLAVKALMKLASLGLQFS